MRLLGNLYIKKAPLDTWNGKDEGWLDYFSKIKFNVSLEKNRLYCATILLDEKDIEDLFHELEHFDILRVLQHIGLHLKEYFDLDIHSRHKMMSDYDPTLWTKAIK